MVGQPAVFLDRDGTINEEVEYLSDPDRLRLLPRAAEGIRLLNRAGLLTIVVTNQAGVGRGYFPPEAVEAVHERLARELAAQGARVDGVYVCPHHPDDGCSCRKPKPGMILRAIEGHPIDLVRSVVVGDKVSDLEAGRAAGCRTVLVLTGYGVAQQAACAGRGVRPDHVAADLFDAATWILAHRDVPGPPG